MNLEEDTKLQGRDVRRCDACSVCVLDSLTTQPFAVGVHTSWKCDGIAWLLTPYASLRSCMPPDGDTDAILRLNGSQGVVDAARTPQYVAVGTETPVYFRNVSEQLRAREWYVVSLRVDRPDRVLCRSCLWNVRQLRIWWRSLTRRLSRSCAGPGECGYGRDERDDDRERGHEVEDPVVLDQDVPDP